MTDDEAVAVAMLRSVADHDKVDVLAPKGDMVVCTPAELARAMRAYGKACADAATERAAKVCDDMVLYTGYDCAAAIRGS